jgi:hypothetical protein
MASRFSRRNLVKGIATTVLAPYVKDDEGFIDEENVKMLAVMREMIKVKYTREFYPEHPRGIDYDRARGRIRG